MLEKTHKKFNNGVVYALETEDGYPIEVTDTFLPLYTKNAAAMQTNALHDTVVGSRKERWMIGVSTMSGCPVKCKFCAAGALPKWRSLSAEEIVNQVDFILGKHSNIKFSDAKEHKINYTRMGEPFLNINPLKKAIELINLRYPNTHHYVSTIGIEHSDFSWVTSNITLQISLHACCNTRRDELIPYKHKMTIAELGKIRTTSNLKTTLNLTLAEETDFDISVLKKYFDPAHFFIKLSPINQNAISDKNKLGAGVITGYNLK